MYIRNLYKRMIGSNLFWFFMGGFVSWVISSQYYYISDASSRETLLNNAILEVRLIKQHENYEPYYNKAKYNEAARPFPRIINLSFQEIYKSINLFSSADSLLKHELTDIVVECMFKIDAFNVRIGIRNDAILINLNNVDKFNAGAFRTYDEVIVPKLGEFVNFAEKNKRDLIDKPFIQCLFEAVF